MTRHLLLAAALFLVASRAFAQNADETATRILNFYPGTAPDSLLSPANHAVGDVVVCLMSGFGYYVSFYVRDAEGQVSHQKVSIGITPAKKSAKHPVKPWYDMVYHRWVNDSTVALRLVDSGSDTQYAFSAFGRGKLNGIEFPKRTVTVENAVKGKNTAKGKNTVKGKKK